MQICDVLVAVAVAEAPYYIRQRDFVGAFICQWFWTLNFLG